MNQKIRINSFVKLNGSEKIIGIVRDIKIDITNGQRVAIVETAGSRVQPIPFSDLREFCGLEAVIEVLSPLPAAILKLANTIKKQHEAVRSNHGR